MKRRYLPILPKTEPGALEQRLAHVIAEREASSSEEPGLEKERQSEVFPSIPEPVRPNTPELPARGAGEAAERENCPIDRHDGGRHGEPAGQPGVTAAIPADKSDAAAGADGQRPTAAGDGDCGNTAERDGGNDEHVVDLSSSAGVGKSKGRRFTEFRAANISTETVTVSTTDPPFKSGAVFDDDQPVNVPPSSFRRRDQRKRSLPGASEPVLMGRVMRRSSAPFAVGRDEARRIHESTRRVAPNNRTDCEDDRAGKREHHKPSSSIKETSRPAAEAGTAGPSDQHSVLPPGSDLQPHAMSRPPPPLTKIRTRDRMQELLAIEEMDELCVQDGGEISEKSIHDAAIAMADTMTREWVRQEFGRIPESANHGAYYYRIKALNIQRETLADKMKKLGISPTLRPFVYTDIALVKMDTKEMNELKIRHAKLEDAKALVNRMDLSHFLFLVHEIETMAELLN